MPVSVLPVKQPGAEARAAGIDLDRQQLSVLQLVT